MKKIARELFWWIKTLAIALVCAILINNTLIAHAQVISGSMESTIMTGSRVMGSRISYVLNQPERFDIILFDPPYDAPMLYVKRIIGLPNETVVIIDGNVYIDGSNIPLDDSFINEPARGNYGPFFVPNGSYFVMGDNRNRSSDSRHWANSFVPHENIVGRLYFEYFPTPHFFE